MAYRASRVWPFVGGALGVAAITYVSYRQIRVASSDAVEKMRDMKRQRELDKGTALEKMGNGSQIQISKAMIRLSDRMKKAWNEDIEKSVRRVQNTDWLRMSQDMGKNLKRAQERVSASVQRMMGGKEEK